MGPRNLQEYREQALLKMDPAARVYLECGSGEEATLRGNLYSFDQWWIRPRVLSEGFPPHIKDLKIEIEVMGSRVSMPIMVSPSAAHLWYHPGGEIASVRGVTGEKTLFVASSSASTTLEEIAANKLNDLLWFQLYVYETRRLSEEMIVRAKKAGYKALVLTVDTPLYGPKESFSFYHQHPQHISKANHVSYPPGSDQVVPLSWKDIDWIRSITDMPIVLKGVMCVEDALRAYEMGIKAIIVSNHGGRQLDYAMPTLVALKELAEGLKEHQVEMEIYMDGGVRKGSDVFKALALGARGVFIGRPIHYGLTLGGSEGVARILQILKEELVTAMVLAGTPTLNSITSNSLKTKNF